MKINNSWEVKPLLILLLIGGLSINSQAQTEEVMVINDVMKLCDMQFGGGGFGNDDPEAYCENGTVIANLEDGCPTGTISLSAFAVDLYPNPVSGIKYLWPEGLPPLYLRYEYSPGLFLVTEQINSWSFLIDHSSGHQIFEGTVEVSIELLENWNCSISGSTGTTESTGNTPSTIQVHIVTPIAFPPLLFDLYPIDDPEYAHKNGIFSCQVFIDNCTTCDLIPNPNDIPCDEETAGIPIYDMTLCVPCSGCQIIKNDPPTSGNQRLRIAGSTEGRPSSLTVSPNPFTNAIQYEYISQTDTEVSVRLFNPTGQEVIRENQKVGIGENTFRLDTSLLPQGVYYLKVGDAKVNRLIKMK